MSNDEEVSLKIKNYARDILADPSNHEHLMDVINHSIVIISHTGCHNCYKSMYICI